MSNTGRIGGAFEVSRNAPFLQERVQYFDSLWRRYQDELAGTATLIPVRRSLHSMQLLNACCLCTWCVLIAKEKPTIQITLPSGDVQEGEAFVTTPMDVAKRISDGLAQAVLIAKVNGRSGAHSGRSLDEAIRSRVQRLSASCASNKIRSCTLSDTTKMSRL